jgi:hypothetical protein
VVEDDSRLGLEDVGGVRAGASRSIGIVENVFDRRLSNFALKIWYVFGSTRESSTAFGSFSGNRRPDSTRISGPT